MFHAIYIFFSFLFHLPAIIKMRLKDKKELGLKLYGVVAYYGRSGSGKTIFIVKNLEDLRAKYGDQILIATNFGYKGEDFALEDWRQLLKPYPKPLVVGYDEIANEFNSRQYKNAPMSLFCILTQLRKGNTIQIHYACQYFHMVDKIFRYQSFYCYDMKTIAGCFTIAKKYHPLDYEELCGRTDEDKRLKIKPLDVTCFVQTDYLRSRYDSFQMLESARNKEYMTRDEIAIINSYENN